MLLPGMDGTALLGGQFRAALDPSISLVVRLVDLLLSLWLSLRRACMFGECLCVFPSLFIVFFMWSDSAWVLTSTACSGCLDVKSLSTFVCLSILFFRLSQEASYPCNELLDTAQLASGVVPTFAAQAREMHPTGRYVVVAQSFSGHGTCYVVRSSLDCSCLRACFLLLFSVAASMGRVRQVRPFARFVFSFVDRVFSCCVSYNSLSTGRSRGLGGGCPCMDVPPSPPLPQWPCGTLTRARRDWRVLS